MRIQSQTRRILSPISRRHTKVLVCPTVINLSSKRLLYIMPTLLAILAGPHDDVPAKRQQCDTLSALASEASHTSRREQPRIVVSSKF